MEVVKKVDPRVLITRKQTFFFSFFWHLYEMEDIHKLTVGIVSEHICQIMRLYTLNLDSALCQLCLNKSGKNLFQNPRRQDTKEMPP